MHFNTLHFSLAPHYETNSSFSYNIYTPKIQHQDQFCGYNVQLICFDLALVCTSRVFMNINHMTS